MNVIETTGLGKCYGKAWALRDCTLAVPEGSLAALVGPNGAGKSTLMNMTVGLTAPTAGTATVLGGQATGSPAALNDIAFMAQDAPLYRNLSVADMLHLTRNLNRRFDYLAARARLADLGIPLDKKTGKLSGGQQAQVALTLALARRPRLLILDEPVSSLDPEGRRDLLALIADLRASATVIFSTHVLADVERICDRVGIMAAGRLVTEGPLDELLERYARPLYRIEPDPGQEATTAALAASLRAVVSAPPAGSPPWTSQSRGLRTRRT